MGDVVVLSVDTTLDLPLERILDGAREHDLSDVLLCGYEPSGQFYIASQIADAAKLLVLLERAKAALLRQLDIGGPADVQR